MLITEMKEVTLLLPLTADMQLQKQVEYKKTCQSQNIVSSLMNDSHLRREHF
jgi:hypothetical protein